MLIKPKRAVRQSWRQQLAIAQMWSARGGGRVYKKVN
jgi:hypothetical protein